jgi:hypothetical protein
MPMITAFLAGLLFGSGLILSGMSNPAKVLAFLDVAGRWDPSLIFVMVGAILVAAIAFRVGGARARTVFGGAIHMPGAATSTPAWCWAAWCSASAGAWSATAPARR